MPNQIAPNLDPQRFQYLNPMVFGEYNAAGDIGWNSAIAQILSYYQGQEPFQDALLDFGELAGDIIEAWKENLVQELVQNDAIELAELVLQTLILVTGEQVEGVEPIVPPEEPEPLPEPEPEEPTPEPDTTREPFPPVVEPRAPQSPPDRGDQPEPSVPPEEPTEPDRPDRPAPPRRQPSPSAPVTPLFSAPVLPVPRQPAPQEPRPAVPESGEEPEEPTPREPAEPESGESPAPGDQEPVPAGIEIDYGALENAIYNALRRWYDLVLSNPPTITVQTDTPPDVNPADLIPQIIQQVDLFQDAGKIIAADNAVIREPQADNIFTIPGEK